MTVVHRWFKSGDYSLLGHTDLPEQSGPVGLVIVPPFGWEEVSSYRPLRFLARSVAGNGTPVLRYDLPGTGDSSGDLMGRGLVEAWIRSVSDAAAELRALAGVEQVAVLGIRLGATLAAVAAGRGGNVQDLVLWGVSPTGDAELREMRAYAKIERWEFEIEPPAGSQAAPGLEVGGFLLTPGIQNDWKALDLTGLSLGPRRVLILPRDGLAVSARLIRALESSGCVVKAGAGTGYFTMMGAPHEAVPPMAVAETIARFLAVPRVVKTVRRQPGPAVTVIQNGDAKAVESVYVVGAPAQSSFGILAEPVAGVPRAESCLLFLNAGAVRHTGPNRMWVEAARRQAARGVASLRLDLPGIGESDGEPNLDTEGLHQQQLVERVELVMNSLQSRFGFRRFVAIGLCAGSFWGFHAAIRNPSVRHAVLLNPRLFFWDPEVDVRRAVRSGMKGLVKPAMWWRVVRGGLQLEDIKRAVVGVFQNSQARLADAFSHPQIPAKRMAEAWRAIERHGTGMTLVFSEREPLLLEMEKEGQMPDPMNSRVRLVRLGKTGHTFRPKWAQKIVHDIIDRDIESVLNQEEAWDRRSDSVVCPPGA